MSLKKISAGIKRNKIFLVTTHASLEGDALGSQLALYKLLKGLGKQVIMINQDEFPFSYSFMPHVEKIKTFDRRVRNTKFDCFVTVDCADLKRCGEVYKLNRKNQPIFNIDHHVSNEGFGTINWIDPHASSCCQMVYQLFKELRVALDRESAMLLYTGILSDTGSFRYSNTSSQTHRIAADLLRFNLDVPGIYRNIYENIPFADMKLLSEILPTMKLDFFGEIAWFQVKSSVLKKQKKTSFDLTEHLLSFARAIKDVKVAVLFKENLGVKNEIRVNFRSQGEVDVNKIADFFGGGGHKTASGTTMHGKIKTVRQRVLAKIKETLNNSMA